MNIFYGNILTSYFVVILLVCPVKGIYKRGGVELRDHHRYIVVIDIHGSLKKFGESMKWDKNKVTRFIHGKYFPKSAEEFDLLVQNMRIKSESEFVAIFFPNLVPRWEIR